MIALPALPHGPAGLRLPPLHQAALLLDLDGTLLDFAARPDAVVVPDGLVDSLLAWRARLDGALAIVTGRPIDAIDALLGDVPTAVAGEHGGAIRHRPDGPIERPLLPDPDPAWADAITRIAASHPGTMLEVKQRGFALHFRAAPEHGPSIQAALAALIAPRAAAFQLLPGALMWELRPAGADKGTAVDRLMRRSPFAGRLPVFIGDDVTDLDGIAAADRLGGAGLLVGDVFGSPAAVRAWLA